MIARINSGLPLMVLTTMTIALAMAGCGESHSGNVHAGTGHEHGDHDHEDHDDAPARFQEGRGLELAADTAAALGVQTAAIAERTITHTFAVTASVFEAGPPVRASSLVPPAVADELGKLPPTDARLVSVRRDLSAALNQVEIVLELPGEEAAVGSTINLTLHGSADEVTAIPQRALLRTASGMFAYVTNGKYLLRTPVQTGASDGAFVEITDGLSAGDVVVTSAVEQLWLTELRLTKGGGHHH